VGFEQLMLDVAASWGSSGKVKAAIRLYLLVKALSHRQRRDHIILEASFHCIHVAAKSLC
jgi:hypothetical protein